MDKTSQIVISYMKEHSDVPLMILDPPSALNVSTDELRRCANYLVSEGLAQYVSDQLGNPLAILPTHKLIHSDEFHRDSLKSWFFNTFIGGVITGVTTTLATELLLYLGAKLLGFL